MNLIYQNELDKAYFQYDMAYGYFKDLPKRAAANKVLRYKAFNIAKNPKHDECHCGLASMVDTFFDKKNSGGTVENEIMFNKELVGELHKPIIKKFKKRTVH